MLQIGTPLPRLDGKKDVNEYKPVWQQEVLDEQGRRRFHGAFTGGYSAGYYNTVGSKEGWAPSTFRSSRKDKEKRVGGSGAMGSRLEDFMDEEDLEAFREGRGALSSTQTYGMEQPPKRERDPLMDMLGLGQDPSKPQAIPDLDQSSSIQVSSSSLGTRLLQRMGWRSGQGLGPRVSFQRRKELLAQSGKPSLEGEVEEEEEAKKHLWPPPDTPMPAFSTKNDAKGLGWTGESGGLGLNEALRRAREENHHTTSESKRAGGFGLGALEEDSDGEDEVYASGNQIKDSTLAKKTGNRWAREDERMVIGNAPSKSASLTRATLSKQDTVLTDNTWHDGRAMIAGFHIASRTNEKDPWFESPQIPKGWKPDPKKVWSQSVTEKAKSNGSAHSMSAADRASILGEARLPGPPPSIQDYLSLKDKERLQRGKEAAALIKEKRPTAVSTEAEIPFLDAATAKAALQGYVPFSNEPEKQQRYQNYLTLQANPTEKKSLATAVRPSLHQNHAQFIAELRDFAKSASIFKPMSIVMASRFQSSVSGSNDIPQINPGLYIPEQKPTMSSEEEKAKLESQKRQEENRKRKEEMETLTSFQRNARLGNFGKSTTRQVMTWKPARLLCKRFNVPMPYPEVEEEEAVGSEKPKEEDDMEAAFGASKMKKLDTPKVNAKWEASKRQLQQLAAQKSWEDQGSAGASSSVEGKGQQDPGEAIKGHQSKGAVDVNNIGLGEVQVKEEETNFVKPAMDVFKAVFADDESDDDEDQDEKKEVQEQEQTEVVAPKALKKELEESTSIESFKPTFVPRKRRAEDGTKKEGGEKKKKKEKSKTKGLLTFSVDDEEEEVESKGGESTFQPKTVTKTSRMRAADLFN